MILPDDTDPDLVHIARCHLSEIGATALMDTLNESRPDATERACLVFLSSTAADVEPHRLLYVDPFNDDVTILAEMLSTERMYWMAHCGAAHQWLLEQGVPPEMLQHIVDTWGNGDKQAADAYRELLWLVTAGEVSDELERKLRDDAGRLFFLEILMPHLLNSVNDDFKPVELAGRDSKPIVMKIARNAPCPCGGVSSTFKPLLTKEAAYGS